jgi:hypothetical protein
MIINKSLTWTSIWLQSNKTWWYHSSFIFFHPGRLVGSSVGQWIPLQYTLDYEELNNLWQINVSSSPVVEQIFSSFQLLKVHILMFKFEVSMVTIWYFLLYFGYVLFFKLQFLLVKPIGFLDYPLHVQLFAWIKVKFPWLSPILGTLSLFR